MSDHSNYNKEVYMCSDVNAEQFEYLYKISEELEKHIELVYACHLGYYRKLHSGGKLKRISLRIRTKVWAALRLVWRAWKAPKGATFVITTSPFYAVWLVTKLKRKGRRIVHLFYDLYPDAIEVLKPNWRNGIVCKLAARVTRSSQRRCCGAVYLGEFLRAHAEHRYGVADGSSTIDVVADTKLFPEHEPIELHPSGLVRFRYGGQLGHMHCAGLLAECVAKSVEAQGASLEYSFYASGPGVDIAHPILAKSGIQLNPPADNKDWRKELVNYDIALTSLSPGGATVCFPSKTYSMLAAGLAIVAICPKWSDMGRLVIENEVGWVVDNSSWPAILTADGRRFGCPKGAALSMDDPEYLEQIHSMRNSKAVHHDFLEVIQEILNNPEEVLRRRQNAWKLAHQKFNESWVVENWTKVLNEAEKSTHVL
jgi:glycosyltransferase involved in cell wall biosynthesis